MKLLLTTGPAAAAVPVGDVHSARGRHSFVGADAGVAADAALGCRAGTPGRHGLLWRQLLLHPCAAGQEVRAALQGHRCAGGPLSRLPQGGAPAARRVAPVPPHLRAAVSAGLLILSTLCFPPCHSQCVRQSPRYAEISLCALLRSSTTCCICLRSRLLCIIYNETEAPRKQSTDQHLRPAHWLSL